MNHRRHVPRSVGMPTRYAIRWAMGVFCSLGLLATALGGDLAESFENGLPPHWNAHRKNALSISGDHFKHGSKSLRWDWRKADALVVTHGLGDTHRVGGPGNARKAAFGLWIWNGTALDSALTIQFCSGETVTAWFDVPLNFRGWRRVQRRYSWKPQMTGKVSPKTDVIRILAPRDASGGTLFFDPIVYNGLADSRLTPPANGKLWKPATPDPTTNPLPKALTPEQLREVNLVHRQIDQRYARKEPADDREFARLTVHSAALGITRSKAGIAGDPIVGDVRFYESAGLRNFVNPDSVAQLSLALAKAHRAAVSVMPRIELADMYLDLHDHLRDQGLREDGGLVLGKRSQLDVAISTVLMHTLLSKRKRLAQAANWFDYVYDARRVFDDTDDVTDVESFGKHLHLRLLGALLQPTPERQYQWLNAYGRYLSRVILSLGGQPSDGSLMVDQANGMTHAGDLLSPLAENLNALMNTSFTVSDTAYARLKRLFLTMRFCSNAGEFPLSINGGHGIDLFPLKALFLTAMSVPKGDPQLMAAFLRLRPDDGWPGHRPEANPVGNLWLPDVGLMAQRRSDWLVTVKGPDRNNLQSLANGGFLEVIPAAGRRAGGCVKSGWDDHRLGGTTMTPSSKEAPASPPTEATKDLIGGLSHRGMNGIVAMQRLGTSPQFTKSYAFFDDIVVCLGTGIHTTDAQNPTHTTLFQTSLKVGSKMLAVDGKAHTADAKPISLKADRHHLVVDPAGNGYYLPKGQSMTVSMKSNANSKGFATAWINHGNAPKNAGYEYVLLVGMTEDEHKTFRLNANGTLPPYTTFRKNARAHIVRAAEPNTWACAFFKPQTVGLEGAGLPIASVKNPCVMMTSPGPAGKLFISVAGIATAQTSEATVIITLAPNWTILNPPTGVTATGTTVTVRCNQGRGQTFTLQKRRD